MVDKVASNEELHVRQLLNKETKMSNLLNLPVILPKLRKMGGPGIARGVISGTYGRRIKKFVRVKLDKPLKSKKDQKALLGS